MLTVGGRVQRFEVVAHLGTGGMGSVFRARDPQLERDVALKLLARPRDNVPRLSVNETLDLRSGGAVSPDDLLSEARMMARLSHPNVLPVYEVGLVEDAVFVVMECIDGSDLRAWLAEPRSPAAIADVFTQAARGLAAAHAHDIVHRDFKPENVLVGRDGRVRVADFGLSRLAARPAAGMVRLDRDHGTPRYMAPELWRGESATKQSDVFAYCVALAEAYGAEPGDHLDRTLRERGVSPQLRTTIVAGLAEDPRARPDLATVVAALGGRAPSRRRWLIAGATAAAIGIGVTAGLARSGSSAPSCDVDSGLAPGHWDDARRAELRHALEPKAPSTWSRDAIARIVATFDGIQRDIERHWRLTCEARRDNTVTDDQASMRRSCLERREIELDARVKQLEHGNDDLHLKLEAAGTSPVDDCPDLVAPAIRGDRAAVAALYQRFADLTPNPSASARVPPETFEAIEHDAAALGEREVEARAAMYAAISHRELDHFEPADQALQRSSRAYVEMHSIRYQAIALLERSRTASKHGDQHEAQSFAQLALELVEREKAYPWIRAIVYHDVGITALQRGDPTALDKLDKALVELAKTNHSIPTVEADVRVYRAAALGAIEGKYDAALAAAREAVEWTRTALGEHSQMYGVALSQLANTIQARDPKAALPIAKQALDVMSEAAVPGDSRIEMMRGNYAGILETDDQYEEALKVYSLELANAEHITALRAFLPLLTFRVGALTCKLGRCDEGMPLLERGIELGATQYGPDHQYTLQYRRELLGIQLAVDKLDDAERTYAKLDQSYKAQHGKYDRTMTIMHGVSGSIIALRRGKFRDAEQLSRSALASWDELKGDDASRSYLESTLAEALIEQHRWSDANAALTRAVTLLKKTPYGERDMAEVDVDIALIEAATGHKAAAVARATRAKQILDRYPLDTDGRRRADRVLAPPKRR